MIEGARRVEAGFNLSMEKANSKGIKKTTKVKDESEDEGTKPVDVDALAQQLQQLSLNYANLTSVLMAQN